MRAKRGRALTASVFINGRFLTQPVTGVQRFSAEITAAIDRLSAAGEWPETAVLAPRAAATGRPSEPATCGGLPVNEVGRRRGHLWEQADLPAASRSGVLVSLGNTAPVLSGRRQVVVIHDAGVFDTPESYSFRFRAWLKTVQHALVRAGARIATVSQFSRDRIVARLGIDPARVAVIYEGADHILRVPADPVALDRHGLRPGRFALVVGSLAAHKNLAGLRGAALALERRGMVLAVAGGFYRGVFRDVAGEEFAGRALGRVSDAELRTLYEGAACLLTPSRYEGFGLPPVEAMSCGCPVLAAPGGAVQEVCGDGALYWGGEPSDVASALERLLDEPGVAERQRARGRARAAALSWDASARALGAVVAEVAARAKPTGRMRRRTR